MSATAILEGEEGGGVTPFVYFERIVDATVDVMRFTLPARNRTE